MSVWVAPSTLARISNKLQQEVLSGFFLGFSEGLLRVQAGWKKVLAGPTRGLLLAAWAGPQSQGETHFHVSDSSSKIFAVLLFQFFTIPNHLFPKKKPVIGTEGFSAQSSTHLG